MLEKSKNIIFLFIFIEILNAAANFSINGEFLLHVIARYLA